MNYTAILASIMTGVLSIGAIGLFLKKNLPMIVKWVTVLNKAFALIDDLIESIEPNVDGKIDLTKEEIEKLKNDAILLKTQWNNVWSK